MVTNKLWCLEHGEEGSHHKSAAVRYINDDATGLTITVAQIDGQVCIHLQNDGSRHTGVYVLDPDEIFFVRLRERKAGEL